MLSQFTKELPTHTSLGDLDFNFKKDVYPVGRLDADSEGLLVLTNNTALNVELLHPENKKEKTYWVQAEGNLSPVDLQPLAKGIQIRVNKKLYHTMPAKVNILPNAVENSLPDRHPPIRQRKNKTETWVEIKITEGKNRQVRKMFAKIGFPVLRLVRVGIGRLMYGKEPVYFLQPGNVYQLNNFNF